MEFKERIKYINKNGLFIGKFTNYPCVTQAGSIEELQRRLTIMLKSYIKMTQGILDNNSFEIVEITENEF